CLTFGLDRVDAGVRGVGPLIHGATEPAGSISSRWKRGPEILLGIVGRAFVNVDLYIFQRCKSCAADVHEIPGVVLLLVGPEYWTGQIPRSLARFEDLQRRNCKHAK